MANFGILVVSARLLGSNVVGQINVLILNVAIIQSVNEVYTGSSLVHFVPGSSIAHIYRRGVFLTMLTTGICNLVFYLANPGYILWPHVLCLSFLITVQAFHNVLLLAKQKVVLYSFLVFLQPATLFTSLALQTMLANKSGIDVYLIAIYTSFGLSLLVSTPAVVKLLAVSRETGRAPLGAVLKNGVMNELGNLAHTLSNRLNYFLLGSASLVGIYASSTSLIEGIWIISGSVSPVILSYVANRQNASGNASIALTLAKICFLLGVVAVGVVFLLPVSLFTAILGNDFVQAKEVMLLLSPGILCLTFSSIISHYFSGLGQQKIQLGANVAGLLVTICLAWPLIGQFGLRGACYTASLAYFVQALALTVVFLRRNHLRFSDLLTGPLSFTRHN